MFRRSVVCGEVLAVLHLHLWWFYFVLGALCKVYEELPARARPTTLGLLGEIVWISHYLKHNCVPLYMAAQFHCETCCLPPQLYYILLSGAFSQFPSYMRLHIESCTNLCHKIVFVSRQILYTITCSYTQTLARVTHAHCSCFPRWD